MSHNENGAGASRENAPEKEESRPGTAATSESLSLKSAPIVDECAQADKAFATLAARFALLGHELHVKYYEGGRRIFEVRRWGHARTFSHEHDLQAFLTQIGGPAR
ncbi:hypothetical protein [Variovorax sp. UC74_104]|uniref:hypothetical protein n=1 Tax=Variovorax sp. UC74_104 TaxID=3374555 RepID=UPI003757E58B